MHQPIETHYRKKVDAGRGAHYSVRLTPDLLGDGLSELAAHLLGRKAMMITTPTVARLHGEALYGKLRDAGHDLSLLVLPCNEQNKTMETVTQICAEAQARGLDRKSILVAVGGGVCSDLVTMAASLIRRGIDTLRVPTTLIGQIDAAVGIKGAVNFGGKKSGLGCFYPPLAVLVDPGFLHTLPQRHLRSGFAEIIKMALVRDERLFHLCETHGPRLIETRFQEAEEVGAEIIWRAAARMLEELETNFFEELTYERLVDFGHSFSPVMEAASNFALNHGEAVSVDMAFCAALAVELGLLSEADYHRMVGLLHTLGLPVNVALLNAATMEQALDEICRHRAGRPNLVLPTGLGAADFITERDRLTPDLLRRAKNRLTTHFPEQSIPSAGVTLAFDIGGTTLRAAVHNGRHAPQKSLRVATPGFETMPDATPQDIYRALLTTMADAADELLDGVPPEAVGVAFPGPIDGDNRVVSAPTVWGPTVDTPFPLSHDLQGLWPGARCVVMNDVTAGGYRYVGRARRTFCIVTVSSGIGNKIFIDGQPVTGPHGRGGELGHLVVDARPDALRCDCGGRGHLGAISSGRGSLRAARALAQAEPDAFAASQAASACGHNPDALTNPMLVDAFRAGDPWTHDLIRQTAQPLARVLAQQHLALGLEDFIVVGGFALALGEAYRHILVSEARAACWDSGVDWNQIIHLGLADDDAGLIGAGLAAQAARTSTPTGA